MAILADLNVYANQDKRTDARSFQTVNAYSIVYNPQIAHPGATISGNKNTADSNARADWEQSSESGFTGKNAQTVLIAGIGIVTVAAAAYILLPKI